MNTAPVLTYPCGCRGIVTEDALSNTCIRPDKACAVHSRGPPSKVPRVYECGCWVWALDDKEVNMRCKPHEHESSMRYAPFIIGCEVVHSKCGCVGQTIGRVLKTQNPVYFVPAEHVCQTHQLLVGTGAIVLEACGCALGAIKKPVYCELHAGAVALPFTDPFTEPSEKPVVIHKK